MVKLFLQLLVEVEKALGYIEFGHLKEQQRQRIDHSLFGLIRKLHRVLGRIKTIQEFVAGQDLAAYFRI